ncbi:hypothetical protein QFC21_006311 [Naganishia friedmannii]|uniref:Uncharacterized protein n=1 Tax=Naganishia friedmannii TaxID=89922 RepID=A0ACC2V2Y5_9TREE|nr:hypothetical protein QFC21_006311 [Naganishia friedmannii]
MQHTNMDGSRPVDTPAGGFPASQNTESVAATIIDSGEGVPEETSDLPDDTTLTSKDQTAWEEKDSKDPNEVGFDGRDDPFDPLNQPIWRKWVSVFTVASGAICVTCASSMASSTYAGIERSFGISSEVAILTVSLFVIGLGLGPLLLGPVSEFVGRRAVYLGSFAAFLLFNIPVAFANNAPVHLIFRFMTGLAGSSFLSVAGGTVADLFENDKLGTPMAIYSTSPFLGPVLGPLISGFINQNTTWRWTFYLVLIWAGVELVLIYLFAPETYKPQVLKIKAKHLRKTTGNQELYAPVERSDRSFMQTLAVSIKTPFIILATQPMAVLLNLWTSVILGILYLFFNAFPITFMGNKGFNQQESGLSFLGIGIGQVLASACAPFWSRVYKKEAAKHGGVAPPESRLLMGMAGAIATPIGLFIFAFTTYPNVHWIAPILGSIPFGMGIVWTFSSVFTYLVDAYRPVAASAMASNSFMRSSFAAGFPLFAKQMFDKLGTVGASALLAGITCLLAPLPFIFYRLGGGIRERSKFGAGSKVNEQNASDNKKA